MLVLAVLLFAVSPLQAQEVDLESLLSAPFPSALTAAPEDGAVAWVENDKGVRNIWMAEPPDYEARQVTEFTEDDGQPLSELAITPDEQHIVFVRGGSPNRMGEHPNPRSDPRGAERTIWMVDVEDGEPVRLARGHAPALSPGGEGMAFLRRGKVYWMELEEGAGDRQLFRARGQATSLRWSPDGSKLAFVSNRSSHSFVGIYDREATALRYMAAGVDRDSSPIWSPDGAEIAFLRRPAESEGTIFTPQREAQPWSIVVADVETGRGGPVWQAEEGTGSVFREVEAESQLHWGADDRIVFPWEGNGWTQLYSITSEGEDLQHLTPGEHEVEYVALSHDGRQAIYNSNQDDRERRHIWRVDVTGGSPEQLTDGDEIEWAPTPTNDGTGIVFFQSGARIPAHAAFINPTSIPPRPLAGETAPSGFPREELVEPQAVTYTAADGKEISAQLFLPPDIEEGEERPAVVFVHGGSRRQMLLGWHYNRYYHHAYALNQHLASRGYVVLSINFRSGTGYGMEFREAENYGAAGGAELFDVLGAGLYLKNRPEVDPERIGLWGGSYGGYLTALGLARASDLFAAGVDIHGVHDWNVGIETFRPGYDPKDDPEQAETAFQASPMAHVDTWESPVLLIHGDDDRNVRFIETINLVEALREREVDVEQLVFPDEVHTFLVHEHWLRAYEATADFFDRKLGD